ncbi:D-hexose-6-phosphate mutarotase [Granulicella sp. WH15]|uniref:D-hexose-6-phosphate mutarotase n=1 Tax=Granulicella sp. WH15 TaxID=2602070 RepID=UPI0013677508|nr:D-hexose-6-phosphate mutarotase [Granulicella sp. WH15]QHN05179.1 D-hexose-6-phosphate mutarotase [Granulicella sp. WH15]
MDIKKLNEEFGLDGVLAFEEHEGMVRAQVTSSSATATIYLHGAHVTHWQPAGHDPVLYLSPNTEIAEGKAIRGGVPICFPWFGPRADGKPGPSHGFARTQSWDVAFAALVPGAGREQVHLSLTLGPTELSRSLGFDHFRVAYQLVIGRTLKLRLAVANLGDRPMHIEEALHTYFAVPDVRKVSITGLEGAEYIDKMDKMALKRLPEEPLEITETTDRVFPGHKATCTIKTGNPATDINNRKANSATTVVWNPWNLVLGDLPADGWEHFVCVETANTGADSVTIAPGDSHTMEAEISVGPPPPPRTPEAAPAS